jgi:hypothetical protein
MFRRALLIAALALPVAALAPTSVMAATGPAWSIVSVAQPTNVASPSPATEVDEVTVDATGGTFTVTSQGLGVTAPIPYNASAAQLESTLNELLAGDKYAPAAPSVSVTGGPGGAAPYVIDFETNSAENSTLASIGVGDLKTDSSQLTGGTHTATTSVLTHGRDRPQLVLTAINVGGSSADGSSHPITISDVLPAGLVPTEIWGRNTGMVDNDSSHSNLLSCSLTTLSCTWSGPTDPGDTLIVTVRLSVEAGLPSSVVNQATVSGGGAESATATNPVTISPTPSDFGITPGSVVAVSSTSQAGAHPNLTTAFFLNTVGMQKQPAGDGTPDVLSIAAGHPKDIRFDLPPGLVGNTVGMPTCSMADVVADACPSNTMVGVVYVTTDFFYASNFTRPVYNIAPAPGEPAAFAFNAVAFPVRLDTSVLSDGNYAVRVTAPNLTEAAGTVSSSITIWGVPADHNGPGPDSWLSVGGVRHSFGGSTGAEQKRVPLLTNAQQCASPLTATLSVDSWVSQGSFQSVPVSLGTPTGCDLLAFTPLIAMLPDTFQAGAPAGYSFDLQVPQSNGPDGLATPDVRNVTVALPMGTVVSPSIADGLGVCSDDPNVDPSAVPNEFGLHSLSPASCDRSSQIGTVKITTPALPVPLEGEVFLGAPACSPCSPADAQAGRLVRLFLQVIGQGDNGITVKVQGTASINQQTGQITATFADNPQLPFNELKLTLGGGERAALANPRTCGPATTTADLTPWSAPFTPDATPSYSFNVTGCSAPRFAPSFHAGVTNLQAGAFTPFTLGFGRSDADDFLNGIRTQLPPGLLGMLSSVQRCGEPQASQGTCGPQSLIGHVQVLTGPGGDPFLVTGGQVFITGPYNGAPYGLSIVVPAAAGPYTLSGTTGQGTVVVRAQINVDPHTAALTVTSDPLPTRLDGIPLQLKVVNVTIDRPGFMFNPTSCNPMAIGATETSDQGATAAISAPYQLTGCQALRFEPKFRVSTSGHTSKANGASLDARVSFPAGSIGAEANIAYVKVELPKQLPSRLTTLQKACLAATFEANPATCPPASVIGIVHATTPVLPVPLSGPVYFVSHGGESFPSLIAVLQGDGVRVDLTGTTFIDKHGITSSTFKTVPDVPVSSFELYLPQGRYSALGASTNLCNSRMVMPTTFLAQNGAAIHQNTRLTVTGCHKAKNARHSRNALRARRARHQHSTKGGK